MFRTALEGVIAAIVIPLIQFSVLIAALSGVTLSANTMAAYVFFAFMFREILIVSIVLVNVIVWATFKRIRSFGVNTTIAAVLSVVPATALSSLLDGPDGIGAFAGVFGFLFSGFVLIAVLTACGSTGRGLAYDLGLKIDD